MRILLFTIAILVLHSTSAQKKILIVRAGEVPSEVLPPEAIYVFPTFKPGAVYMRDGSISTTKLNYNILVNEMHFIGDKGDTLAIAFPETIKNIRIDTTLFFYEKNYLQVVYQVDSFKIAIKQVFLQLPYRTRGGYDAPLGAGSITTFGTISSSGANAKLQVKKDVRMEKEISYFISDKFNHFFKADKKAFLNIFSLKKNSIEIYLKQNNVDYSKENDLEELLRFCVTAN
ncbi:hypothetical protein [Segetibacter aerophilus]|nr:hypothetical protein [Segetibacter aerophilus]